MSCFAHALLNTWDYHQKGYNVALIIEGASCERVRDVDQSPHAPLWQKIRDAGLVKAVCKACSAQLGSLEKAEEENLPIDSSLSGHVSLEPYSKEGFEFIVF